MSSFRKMTDDDLAAAVSSTWALPRDIAGALAEKARRAGQSAASSCAPTSSMGEPATGNSSAQTIPMGQNFIIDPDTGRSYPQAMPMGPDFVVEKRPHAGASAQTGPGEFSHISIEGDEDFVARTRAALGRLEGTRSAAVFSGVRYIRQDSHVTGKIAAFASSEGIHVQKSTTDSSQTQYAGTLTHEAKHVERGDNSATPGAEQAAFQAEEEALREIGAPSSDIASVREMARWHTGASLGWWPELDAMAKGN